MKEVSGLIAGTVTIVVLQTWAFMITIGIIHHEWIPQLPTIGFWWAMIIVMGLRCALADVSPNSS